jgi:oxalate decarboxylase
VQSLKWPFALSHNRVLSGGWARETTTRELPISTEIAGVNMRLTPGGIRELHWHKEAEWAYVIAGSCRISILDEEGRLFTDDVSVGDLWYFPSGLPHSIQALKDGVEFLLAFDSGDFSENETFLITDSRNFPVSKTIAAVLIEVEAGGMRELHWHPNADEWQYWLNGQGRMTVFASGGKSRTFDFRSGDVGYAPRAMGHYIENTGDETLTYLALFRSDHYADISLSQWMGVLPPALVKAHLNLDDDVIADLPRGKPVVVA